MAAETDTVAGWIVNIIIGGGGLAFIVNLVTGWAKAKREKVEGSAILVNSASAYAKQLTEDNAKMRGEFADLRQEFEQYRRDQARRDRDQRSRFEDHQRWDDSVRAMLRQLGETIPPPPPLYTDA